MLEASASAHQWEFFDYVYQELTPSGEHLDFTKHSASLLEASWAGKWHLLEHAFDTILEAGEVPPVSFFTEMVCHATARCDYERAVRMINSMAHAPSQVGFEKWVKLFEKNVDMIGRANLNELHETLVSRDLVQEAAVLNLSRALHNICRSHDHDSMIGKGPDLADNAHTSQGDSNDMMGSAKTSFCSEDQETEGAGVAGLVDQSFDDDLEWEMSESDYDEQESVDVENREVLSNVDDFNFELVIPKSENDSQELDMPFAYEILKSWKDERKA